MCRRSQRTSRQIHGRSVFRGDDSASLREKRGGWTRLVVALVVLAGISIVAGHLLFVRSRVVQDNPTNDDLASWQHTPEYDRTLKTVVMSIAKRDTSLQLQDGILAALPHYTRIILLLPQSSVRMIAADLENKPYRARVRLVTYSPVSLKNSKVWLLFRDEDKLLQVDLNDSRVESYKGNTWIQDMFEVTRDSAGRAFVLRSCIHKYWTTAGAKSAAHIAADNAYLEELSTVGLEVRTLPLAFMGGNIVVDKVNGDQVAFCGGDILKATRIVSESIGGPSLSDLQITTSLADALKVDRIVFVGAGQLQPGQMYHLDQAMILLADRTAGVARIVGKRPQESSQAEEVDKAEVFLTELRRTLRSLDYRIVDIETSSKNVLRCQHYVNAIPYVDAETNQRTVLMPIYRSAQTDFDKTLIRNNTAAFESLGYKVVHVPTMADELRGGIHCLVNVID